MTVCTKNLRDAIDDLRQELRPDCNAENVTQEIAKEYNLKVPLLRWGFKEATSLTPEEYAQIPLVSKAIEFCIPHKVLNLTDSVSPTEVYELARKCGVTPNVIKEFLLRKGRWL